MSRQRVTLHIDTLVLEGFSGTDPGEIGAAIQAELTRLIAAQGLPPQLSAGAHITRLDGGQFELSPGAQAGATGANAARAVFRGMTK